MVNGDFLNAVLLAIAAAKINLLITLPNVDPFVLETQLQAVA